MFEKEAEIYALSNYGFRGKNSQRVLTAKIDYQQGAEFGYNKANEWHYVKDELPPLDTNVLVIHRWAKTPEVGKRVKVFINSSVWVWSMCSDRFRYTSDNKDVIAWKEIVLPELPKESE